MDAGGTQGGFVRFIVGLIMMIGGGYLLLNAIHVSNGFGLGHSMMRVGGIDVTSGMVMIPFMFGVGMIFYNSRNPIGWVLAVASIIMLVFGVITSIQFTFNRLSAFDLIVILVLLVGGIGLFLNSLKDFEGEKPKK